MTNSFLEIPEKHDLEKHMTDWKQQLQDNWADWDFTMKLIEELLAEKDQRCRELTDTIIGEDDKLYPIPNDAIMESTNTLHINRNQLRAEQRQRRDELLGGSK